MAAITFPSSPSTNQVYADGTSAWQWDGTAWRVVRNTSMSSQLQFAKINFNLASLTDAVFSTGTITPRTLTASWPAFSTQSVAINQDTTSNSVTPSAYSYKIYSAYANNSILIGRGFGSITSQNNTLIGSNIITGGTGSSTTGATVLGNSAAQSANQGSGAFTAIGYSALQNNTSFLNSATAIGNLAGQYSSGGTMTFVGSYAGAFAGDSCVAIGTSSLGFASGVTNCVGVGYQTLYQSSGNNNTALGYNAGANVSSGTNNAFLGYNSGTDALVNVTTANNVVVLGNASTATLYCKTSTISTSDVRDKTNIRPITLGLDFVNTIEPIAYQFKVSRQDSTPASRVYLGWRAQDVMAHQGSEEIVDDHDPENLKMAGMDMVAVLWKAVQELSAEVQTLKAKLGD